MSERIAIISDFLFELDQLKTVERRSYINGGERLENSAEHSWHLAMACWAFADMLDDDFDQEKLLKLALVHDIGEIGAGDTFLYSTDRVDAHHNERKYLSELAAHPGNSIDDLQDLWEEQETGNSKETKLLKVVDRLLPFLLNYNSEGHSWKENKIKKSQVLAMHIFIEDDYPEIYHWFITKLNKAVENGWLIDS